MLTRFVIGNHEDCQEIMEFALDLFISNSDVNTFVYQPARYCM